MKTATKKIIERLPVLKKELTSNETQGVEKLSEVEQVFLRLARFFEDPNEENFNVQSLYKHLDNDWLEFALEVIYEFFYQDTYLIQNPTHSIITDGEDYLNQKRFADFLKENGLNYNRAKLNVYLNRGIAPEPDLILSGTQYWERYTCEKFLEEQLQKEKERK